MRNLYKIIPEKLYSGIEHLKKNPEFPLPKKWQFLKVDVKLARSPEYDIRKIPILKQPEEATKFLSGIIDSTRERLYVIYLDTRNKIVGIGEVHIGTTNVSVASPKDIFQIALLTNSSQMIVIHNHPSGDTTPSQDDIQLAKKIAEISRLFDISLLDFIIMAQSGIFSFKRNNLI